MAFNYKLILLFLLFSVATFSNARQISFEKDVVIVDFNDQSTEALKRGPNRELLSLLISKLHAAQAKTIVLKFFIDTPTNEKSDMLMEEAIKSARVILQASVNSDPPASSEIDERFKFEGTLKNVTPRISGKEGWLPLRRFQQYAAKVCFVDTQDVTVVPLVEALNGQAYKSLYTCILEEAIGARLDSMGPDFAYFGDWKIPVTAQGGVKVKLTDLHFPQRIPAETILLSANSLKDIQGKIAIVTYSGAKSPTIRIGGETIKVHQAFLAGLREIFSMIERKVFGVPHASTVSKS